MALIDTYRNNVMRKNNEKVKLIENRGKESLKIVAQNTKISSLKNALTRAKSESIIKSKLNGIQREEKELANIYKKIADYDKKITQKEKEIIAEIGKLQKEEQRNIKKQSDIEARRIKERERQMNDLLNKPTNQYINNGGQMNIANDNAIINATYNRYESESELENLINQIKDSDLSCFDDDEQEVLIDNIDILQEQLSSDKPKRGFIRTAIAGIIPFMHKTTEVTELLQKLMDFVKPIIEL